MLALIVNVGVDGKLFDVGDVHVVHVVHVDAVDGEALRWCSC
jgi:hypothetical protein